jgi:hypothetical protein
LRIDPVNGAPGRDIGIINQGDIVAADIAELIRRLENEGVGSRAAAARASTPKSSRRPVGRCTTS